MLPLEQFYMSENSDSHTCIMISLGDSRCPEFLLSSHTIWQDESTSRKIELPIWVATKWYDSCSRNFWRGEDLWVNFLNILLCSIAHSKLVDFQPFRLRVCTGRQEHRLVQPCVRTCPPVHHQLSWMRGKLRPGTLQSRYNVLSLL